MRILHLGVVLLAAATVVGQAKPKSDHKQESKPDAAQTQVAPDDFVVLITGACLTPPGEFAVRDCVRGVTRQEFEQLLAITRPDAPMGYKQRLAETLAQDIILSNEAKKRGLPKDPDVENLLHFLQLQELAKLLMTYTLKKETAPTDEEVQKFYEAHLIEYQAVDLQRIIVPAKGAEVTDDDRNYAETLRSRCAEGEDMAKLQAAADQRVGRPTDPPVELKNQRRMMYPVPQQETLFALNPGQCAVVAQSNAEFFVLKMTMKSDKPTPEMRATIANALQQAKIKEVTDALAKQNVISLNPKYFPPSPPPTAKPSPSTPN